MSQAIDITSEQREMIVSLLFRYLPNTEAWAYGSRVRWTSRPESDLDIVVFAKPGQARNVSDLREAFEESNLPFRVDLFVWDEVPESFRGEIEREHVVLTNATDAIHSRWPRIEIGDLIDLRLSSVDKKSKPTETPVRLCNYTDVYYNSTIRKGMYFMEATASNREIAKCALSSGDVVITKDSEKYDDIGVPAFVMDDVPDLLCGYHLAILRPDAARIHGRYLYYALNTRDVQTQFHHYANGITRFGLRKADIGLVEIPFPCLEEQRTVARVLGVLDDKIELNRRMNQTLEAMARAIFKDWFVDFGPTRAKMEGSDPYLPPEIWGLFPDAFDREGKPKGWKFDTLARLAATNNESWTTRHHPQVLEYVTLSDAKWGNVSTTTLLDWEDAPSRARRIAKTGDTIVGTTRPGNGSFAYISRDGLTVSTGFAVLSPLAAKYRDAVYLAATSTENIRRLASLAHGHGGTYPAIRPVELSDTAIVFPGDNVLAAFAGLVSPIRERVERSKAESLALTQTRDLLLPKLISGEIRLHRVENLGGEACTE